MNLQERKEILLQLGTYMKSSDEAWEKAKQKASLENLWFIQEFVELSAKNIAQQFLAEEALQAMIQQYGIPSHNTAPKKIGIVMAGNIPMVGFHDLLCTFITGHYSVVKLSSKDAVLLRFLVSMLVEWNPDAAPYFTFSEMLKGCDAYIATGSNNSSHYFEYYFRKYPHVIRKNRTSVAVLTGAESDEELERLADDVYQYFGLGCRNVTKIFVPEGYQFERLLNVFRKYNRLADHAKYKNNYDYNLAIHLLNNQYYMSNESLLLVEDSSLFSPISQLNYAYYKNEAELHPLLQQNEQVQCIVGQNHTGFGKSQAPGIFDYADGIDTVEFLLNLTVEQKYENLSK